jgi:hypothetical protein
MTNTTEIRETKVLWDTTADKLYVWDAASKAWKLFYAAADLVTNDALADALAMKLDKAGGALAGNLAVTGRLALGGAEPDVNNVFIAEGANALFTNPAGSFGFVFSKHATADDAALTFQTNYSTRALIGLLGDDNLTFKVTPDGSVWKTGIVVDAVTGAVEHSQGAKFAAVTNYDNYVAADAWTKIAFNAANHNAYGAFDAGANRFTAPVAGYYLVGAKWRFKANATVPASVQTKLFKNGAARDETLAAAAAPTSERTTLQTQTVLSLAAGDAIDVRALMETHDGYVAAAASLFYAARIA